MAVKSGILIKVVPSAPRREVRAFVTSTVMLSSPRECGIAPGLAQDHHIRGSSHEMSPSRALALPCHPAPECAVAAITRSTASASPT